VDTNEAEGFFPEREILRARRAQALPERVEQSKTRDQRAGVWTVWMALMVAVFMPMMINGSGRFALLAVLYAAAAVCLVAVVVGMNRWHRRIR
jgi:hypothetical protein